MCLLKPGPEFCPPQHTPSKDAPDIPSSMKTLRIKGSEIRGAVGIQLCFSASAITVFISRLLTYTPLFSLEVHSSFLSLPSHTSSQTAHSILPHAVYPFLTLVAACFMFLLFKCVFYRVKHTFMFELQQVVLPKWFKLQPCDRLISYLYYQAIVQLYLIKWPVNIHHFVS